MAIIPTTYGRIPRYYIPKISAIKFLELLAAFITLDESVFR